MESSDRLKLTTEDQRLLYNELQGLKIEKDISFRKNSTGKINLNLKKEENVDTNSSPENNNIFYWVDKLTGEEPRKSTDNTQILQSFGPGYATVNLKSENNTTINVP